MTGRKIVEMQMWQTMDQDTRVVVQRGQSGVQLLGKAGDVEGFCLLKCFDCAAGRKNHEVLDKTQKFDQEDVVVVCRPKKGTRNCATK